MTTFKTETIVREYEDDRLVSETTNTVVKAPQTSLIRPVGFGLPEKDSRSD